MQRTSKPIVKEVLKLYEIGLSKTKIAKKVNLDRKTIWAIIKYPERYIK